MQATTQETSKEQNARTGALYRHVKRTEWGLAKLAWEKDGKRGYQFEDGELRVFADGYYSLLERVDRSSEDLTAISEKLDRQLGNISRRSTKSAVSKADLPTFDEQIAVFLRLFPGGFMDSAWLAEHRGEAGARQLKRHRTPASRKAIEALSKEAIDENIRTGDERAVLQRAIEVLESTDLVTRAQIAPLEGLAPDQGFAAALRDLLYGDDRFDVRFDRYCQVLGRSTKGSPSWPLVTALPALVLPDEHVCIRPSVFATQADVLDPRMRPSKTPSSASYAAYQDMVRTMIEALREAGYPPRDRLDIHDFVWVTLRPGAFKVLEAVRAESGRDEPQRAAATN